VNATITLPRLGIVDDDTEFLSDIAIIQDAVRTTSDPDECLEWVQNGEVDAVVSDLRMPGEGGVGLLQAAREIDPTIPLALWTGFQPDPQERQVLESLEAKILSKTKHRLQDIVGYFEDVFASVPLQKLRIAERRIMELEELNLEWVRDMLQQLREIPDMERALISGAGGGYTVAELIDDIEQMRPRGREYIKLWREAQARLRSYRR
jgi:CheY-like chemotaxis protein